MNDGQERVALGRIQEHEVRPALESPVLRDFEWIAMRRFDGSVFSSDEFLASGALRGRLLRACDARADQKKTPCE
jgi:hypothetical protein